MNKQIFRNSILAIFSLLLISFFTQFLFAQDAWQKMNGPYGGQVNSFAVDSINHVIYAGTQNGIFVTADNEYIWNQIGLGEFRVKSVCINREGHIFAGGYNKIFRSTDEGQTWVDIYTGWVSGMAINSKGHLFATIINYGAIRSTDNGNSWVQLGNGLMNVQFFTIFINSTDDIFIGPDWSYLPFAGVYRSSDYGESWERFSSGLPPGSSIYSMTQNPSGELFLSLDYGVYTSSDNGENWAERSNGLGYNTINTLTATSDNTLFAGGYGVFRSTDDGNSWSLSNNGMASDIVYELDVKAGDEILLGSAGGCFSSTNSGTEWDESNTGILNTNVTNIISNSNDDLFAGTVSNGIHASLNNGLDWQPINDGLPGLRVSGLVIDPSGNLFAALYGNGVYRSTNNGNDWEAVNNGLTDLDVRSIAVSSNGNIFAGCDGYDPGDMFRSTDNGNNWEQIIEYSTVGSVGPISINDNDYIFANVCCVNRLWRSTNYGSFWSELISTGQAAQPIVFNSSGDVFFGTCGQGMYRSLDNGVSWEQINNGLLDLCIRAITVDYDENIYASDNYARLYRSTDNGNNWVEIITDLPGQNIIYLYAKDQNIFAGISGNGIFRYGPSTSFENEGRNETPGQFLLLQNYPNPFNPATKIRYSVPQASQVVLKIFDILGAEIEILRNQEEPAGFFEINWEPKGLPGGVYFYQLRASGFSQTKKMIFLK